jgi:hypothetical protein
MKLSRTLSLFAAVVAVGCGGHGAPSAAATADLRIAVEWPSHSRTIPAGTQSILVEVFQNGSKRSERKLTPSEPSHTFRSLSAGTTTVRAKATDVEGWTLAKGEGTLIVRPNVTNTAVVDLTPTLPDHFDMTSTDRFVLLEAAGRDGNELELVPPLPLQRGAVWFPERVRVAEGFETSFQFRMTENGTTAGYETGADGLAFVIQPTGSDVIGEYGGGIGYEGLRNAVVVELDTWYNFGDPNGNHIAVLTNRMDAVTHDHEHALVTNAGVPVLEDGNWHTVRVRLQNQTLTVYLDGGATPVVETALDLASTIALHEGKAFVGFTSATAASHQRVRVREWSFFGRG